MLLRTTRRLFLLASMGVVATAAIVGAPHAKADPPPNCNVAPWGFLGVKTRIICDGPILRGSTAVPTSCPPQQANAYLPARSNDDAVAA